MEKEILDSLIETLDEMGYIIVDQEILSKMINLISPSELDALVEEMETGLLEEFFGAKRC